MTTEAAPTDTASSRPENRTLAQQGLRPSGCVHWNLVAPELIQQAVRRDEGMLADMGPFVAITSPHTGRSPNDKFVVKDPDVAQDVWLGEGEPADLAGEFDDAARRRAQRISTRAAICSCRISGRRGPGVPPLRAASSRPNAWHMRVRAQHVPAPRRSGELRGDSLPNFTVLHAPEYAGAIRASTASAPATFIVLNFAQADDPHRRHALRRRDEEVDVHGDELPAARSRACCRCTAPRTSGAMATPRSSSASRAPARRRCRPIRERGLIGDDEHGWSDDGRVQLRGRLLRQGDQSVDRAASRTSIATTQCSGRARERRARSGHEASGLRRARRSPRTRAPAIRCTYIRNHVPSGRGGHPKNVMFLTADAFGVLPPIARLTREQAMYYFLSGYTAKVAGTERGVTEPQATFSACFGAVFLVWHPTQVRGDARRAARAARTRSVAREHGLDRRRLRRGHRA